MPLALLAEVTYGCPLHCPYCSNPLNLGDYSDELTTQEWQRVLVEAKRLGVLQLHLSGGEPLQRRDLVEIVRTASRWACTRISSRAGSACRLAAPSCCALRASITCRSASRPMSRPLPTASPARRPSSGRKPRPGW